MQLYILLSFCIFILAVTGGLAPLQPILGARRSHILLFILSMLALSRFSPVLRTEFRFNMAALALPIWLGIWARKERVGSGRWVGTVIFLVIMIGWATGAGAFAGAETGLLAGFMAGAGAAGLADTPRSALAAATAIPVGAKLVSALADLAEGAYVALDLSLGSLLDSQFIALSFGSILLCIHAAALAGREEGI